jgi:patatin-related protein
MSSHRSYYQPNFLREMQLGLVVYGGVSLAIYTHGICQEFYNAVRGRGIYKLIKALTDADLVVDVISGSSAGGINGILLGYAIANSNDREIVDFSEFAKIWRNSGEAIKLLKKPNLFKFPLGVNPNSEHGCGAAAQANAMRTTLAHQGLLAALIRGMEHKLPRSSTEWFSTTKELDLAIAGTDYLGRLDRTTEDHQLNGVKDHRAIFRLKHRQGRKEPFNPYYQDPVLPRTPTDTYQALIKLCQLTAGIPVISPLVEIDLQDRKNLVDRQLVTWGKLAKNYTVDFSTNRGTKLYFLDGGLLDNAPLTCLMRESSYRLPTRSSQRKLFYVDPNPEHFNDGIQSIAGADGKQFGKKKSRLEYIFQTVSSSIPIQQSISNDLRTINEHNHKVRRYQTLIDLAETAVDSQQLLASSDRTQSQIYLRGRLFDFRDRNLPLLIQADLGSQNSQYSVILDKIDRILASKFSSSQDRNHYHKLLDRFESQVIDIDVEYSFRQHFYLVDKIADILATDLHVDVRQQLEHLSRQLSCNIKLLEVVRTSLELLLRDRAVNNYFHYLINQESNDRRLRALVYELIFRLHRFLLDGSRFPEFRPNDLAGAKLEAIPAHFWDNLSELASAAHHPGGQDRWLSQAKISSIFAQFKQRIAELQQSTDLHRLIWTDRQLEYDHEGNKSFPSILTQVNLAAKVMIERSDHEYTDQLLKQWNTFEVIDRELYPFEYLTSLNAKEIINPICISPDTAQLGIGTGKNTEQKLGGNKLYNIGGFFKKSWRLNDLLWGRLDGLNRIVESIVTPKSVTHFANFVQREADRIKCSPAQYLDWLLTESLPHLSGNEREVISVHLTDLAQPGLRIDRTKLRKILADLVAAGQSEILTSDVHSVIEGMDEQSGWWRTGSHQTAANQTINSLVYDSPDIIDTSVPGSNPNTITRIIQQSLTNLATQKQHFFRNQYRIGVDKLWENMPLVTLINLCTKMILILRNLLVKVFRTSSQTQIIRYPLYHWLDGGLQAIYWWLQGGTIKLGAVHRRPRIILLQILGISTAIGGIILAILLSPLWLLFSLPGAITCWFLQTMRLKRLTGGKS